MSYSSEWKKGGSLSSIKHGGVVRCKSEKHVPVLAGSKEARIPDVPVQASGDGLRILGDRSIGDRLQKVLQSDVRSQLCSRAASTFSKRAPLVNHPTDTMSWWNNL